MAQHVVYYLFILLLSMLPALFNATDCSRSRGYCPVGLDCNRNNSLCEYPQTRCDLGANRTDNDQGFACGSNLPVCKPLQKDTEIIKNFSDPLVIGAACAAVNQITIKSVFTSKSVLVTITNGTRQVVNGVKFDLMITVALSTTCKKDSELCTSVECPIDESTKQLWMISVVAPPTKLTTQYNVLSIRQLVHIGSVSIEIDERNFFLCSICEEIVSSLESHLDNKVSRKAVKEILINACNNMTIQKSCLDFVNKHFDKIWKAVTQKTLGKLCCDFHLCTCRSNDTVKGTSHGDLCPEGFFCLTGDDCGSNSSLCEVGVCQHTKEENCIQGITVQFSLNKYEVKENNGPAQPELTLSRPLEYSTFAVLIKVEDVTATGSIDYQYLRDDYIQVVISGGADKVPFNITVKDDNILERNEIFRLSIVDVSLPHGITIGSRRSAEVVINDDDRSCVKIDRQTYSVRENLILQVTLSLSLVASYDIGLNIHCVDLNARRYDYDPGPYKVTFRAGNRRATLRINIIDDDIYEGPEAFSFYINTFLPSQVSRCEPYRSTVTILDDERTFRVGFDTSNYIVDEDVGTLSPALTLDRPSPSGITVFAELVDDTANEGGVDYGCPLPIMFEYTFLAGETCITAVDPIPINDDRISERDERFKICIIEASLPLGVQESRDCATITIKDNDIACYFERETYEIHRNKGPLQLRLRLDKPATTEFNLQVYDLNDTANAFADYTPGPYLVTFRRGSRTSNEFSVPIMKDEDDIYTGNKNFNLTIVDDLLPLGIVPGDIISVNVTIFDNEFVCCFNPTNFDVKEGDRVEAYITCSKPLLSSLTVRLQYFDLSADKRTDYYAYPTSVRISAGADRAKVTIRTREDSNLENKYEYFDVKMDYPSKSNSLCDKLCVTVEDDDDAIIKFDRVEYRAAESSLVIPRLILSKTPTLTFTVNITEDHDEGGFCSNATGGEDYRSQHYDTVRFVKGRSRYVELKTEFIKDDIVEDDEFYYLKIVPDTLPDRVIVGNPNYTKVVIQNDDACTVTLEENLLKFSKTIYCNVRVEIAYYTGDPRTVSDTLVAKNTEIVLDASRVNRLQRITIYPCCCLDSNDFRIRASRTYISFSHC